MENFVLALLVNDRRKVLLPLLKGSPRPSEEYIINCGLAVARIPILTIDKSKLVQTLVCSTKDVALKDCTFKCEVNNGRLKVSIDPPKGDIPQQESAPLPEKETSWRDGAVAKTKKQKVDVVKDNGELPQELPALCGIKLGYEESSEAIMIYATPSGDQQIAAENKFNLEIAFNADSYCNSFTIALTDKNSYVHFGFDFGSEASQINEFRYLKNVSSNSFESKESVPSLFDIIKDNKELSNEKDDAFIQFERGSNFYKSIFFAKKQIELRNDADGNDTAIHESEKSLSILNKSIETDRTYFEGWYQLPNLKIAHKYSADLHQYKFTVDNNGQKRTKDISSLNEILYSNILKELIYNYLIASIDKHKKSDLRLTLLIPNMYETSDIIKIRHQIKQKVGEINSENLQNAIRSLEITTLSESDASFMGYYNRDHHNQTEANKYYIIIDCGKGTTDFSVVQTDENDLYDYKTLYRNGFAGAGNLITYAFFEALFYYICSISENPDNAKEFIKKSLDGKSSADINRLFELIEQMKFNYDQDAPQAIIEKFYETAVTGDFNFKNLFNGGESWETIFLLLKNCRSCYDWNGYISETVDFISKSIADNLNNVVKSLGQTVQCGGVLLSGRGFMFKPLRKSVIEHLQQIGIEENLVREPESAKGLKDVCLKGVFRRGYKYNPDIMCMPVRQQNKAQPVGENIEMPIKKERKIFRLFHQKLGEILAEGMDFGSEQNSMKMDATDIKTLRFIIGNSIYEPSNFNLKTGDQLELIYSGDAFVLKAIDHGELIDFCTLEKNSEVEHSESNQIVGSLFPAVLSEKSINFLNQDYSYEDLMPF